MSTIDVFGSVVSALCSGGNLYAGILTFTLFSILIQFSFSIKNYQNIGKSKKMQDEIRSFNESVAKGKDSGSSSLTYIFRKYNYIPFQNTICTVVQTIFGLILSSSLKSEEMGRYVAYLLTVDISSSCRTYAANGGTNFTVIVSVLFAAMLLQFLHDRLLERELATDERPINIIANIALLFAGYFLPCVFSIYWLLHEVADIAMLLVIGKRQENSLNSIANEINGSKQKKNTSAPKKETKKESSRYDW